MPGPAKAQRKRKKPRIPQDVRDANTRVVMTCAPLDDTYETADPNDRAHNVRFENGGLRPARLVPKRHTRARRYPACYMVGPVQHRVSFETAFEETADREARLESMGLHLHRPVSSGSPIAAAVQQALARMQSELGARETIERTRQRTGHAPRKRV